VSASSRKELAPNSSLENEAKTVGLACTAISAEGVAWTTATAGHRHLALTLEGCRGTMDLAMACGGANIPNGNGSIEGVVTDEATKEAPGEVKVTIESGFGIVCGATNFGAMTGSPHGTQATASAVLKFAKAGGITFAGEKMVITGELELLTIAGSKKLFIGPGPPPSPHWYSEGGRLAEANEAGAVAITTGTGTGTAAFTVANFGAKEEGLHTERHRQGLEPNRRRTRPRQANDCGLHELRLVVLQTWRKT
jgi:hypothetical protein